MKILGIETSCDETAAAIVEDGTKILSNVVASSVELHRKSGGIIPEVAAREQLRCLLPVINEALKSAVEIDALAVTAGPGLIGSLLVGIETSRTLAYIWQKPLIPVNHLQAHIYANWLNDQRPPFPALGLVVSGGHTDLVFMKNHREIKWLGGTRDDAAGECFDKTARVLGLTYPGGPAISRLAERGDPQAYSLPRPMINQKNLDFSFAGLKTAVINLTRREKSAGRRINKADLAASIQAAIVDSLINKTLRALKKSPVKSLLLAGGVAANTLLREQLNAKCQKINVQLFIPPIKLCTDNAAMIASCAFFNFQPLFWQKIKSQPSLSIAEMVK